jgi:hypothetical protein
MSSPVLVTWSGGKNPARICAGARSRVFTSSRIEEVTAAAGDTMRKAAESSSGSGTESAKPQTRLSARAENRTMRVMAQYGREPEGYVIVR